MSPTVLVFGVSPEQTEHPMFIAIKLFSLSIASIFVVFFPFPYFNLISVLAVAMKTCNLDSFNYSFFVLYDATEPGIAMINFLSLSPFDGVYWVVPGNSITSNVKVKFLVTRYIPLPSITEFY
jgi:hypothetical protein